MPNYYPISEETARRAWEMCHMSEYRAGSATEEYRASVDAAAAEAEQQKKRVSPFYHDRIDGLLDAYARRLAKWYNDYNRNGASCPSVLISGASNFPVHKKEKQNAREASLWQEYDAIKQLREKITSTGDGPVNLAEPHAREILTGQLSDMQKRLEEEKAANVYYRKHKTLDGCPGITDRDRAWLTRHGVFNAGENGTPLELYGVPFPSYELSSVRGKIKRIEARLAELDALDTRRADPDAADDAQTFDGGEIVRNAELNRLQIVFDHVPAAEIREALKSEGFHWSPKNKAWQRQLTDNAERAARRALGLA